MREIMEEFGVSIVLVVAGLAFSGSLFYFISLL